MRRSILYLDDEVGCLRLFEEMFGKEYDVSTAATPSEARRMLAGSPADIIISDQSMPDMKGTDFLREVAVTYPSSFRVLLTGSVSFGAVIGEIGSGVIHLFVPKPWTEQVMRQMLERAALDH